MAHDFRSAQYTIAAIAIATVAMAETTLMNPPLYTAAEKGDVAEVREQIEKGANPNITEEGQQKLSPLQIAAYKRHFDIVKFLVEKGADINYKTSITPSALGLAISGGDLRIVEFLLQKGADVNTTLPYSRTPLHVAASLEGDRIDIFDLLLKRGANIDAKSWGEMTVLHWAVSNKNHKIVERIMQLRPDMVRMRDLDGRTSLDVAQERKLKAMEKILRAEKGTP